MIKRLTAAICLMARKEDKDLLDSIDHRPMCKQKIIHRTMKD